MWLNVDQYQIVCEPCRSVETSEGLSWPSECCRLLLYRGRFKPVLSGLFSALKG